MSSTLTRVSVAAGLLHAFAEHGYAHVTGVPCSLLKGLFAALESPADGIGGRFRYLPAPREDTALGVASGLTVAGRPTVTLMQNSGLGYCLNVLTSFNLIYDVTLPMVVSWRGYLGLDAVEHDVIGRELLDLLDVFGLPHVLLEPDRPRRSVERLLDAMAVANRPAVLVVREGL